VRVTTIGTSHPKLMLMVSTKALLGESRILNYGLVGYYVLSYSATAALVLQVSISLLGKSVNSQSIHHIYYVPGTIFYSNTLHVCGIAVHPITMGRLVGGS
jgi:hypothetical protein